LYIATNKATEEVYTFADGLVYAVKDWDYCTPRDGRFYTERVNGFVPGVPQLNNNLAAAPMIPINTARLGYGYYSEDDKMLHWFDSTAVRAPRGPEVDWIEKRKKLEC
jgi:hypothetical protein